VQPPKHKCNRMSTAHKSALACMRHGDRIPNGAWDIGYRPFMQRDAR
jgi:hypothetical protein